MRRRRRVAAASLALAVSSVAGIVLLGGGREAGLVASPPVTRPAPTTHATTTAPTTVATTGRSRSTPSSTTSVVTTSTTTTIAPIVTHDARVGVGVLVPVAVPAPVRVAIPSLGADGPVAPGGVDEVGALEIPRDARTLVWWRFGPPPGAPGSAVIAGHLDWKGVPGIFNRLADTPIGERVTVTYDDGHEQSFVVASVELVDKPAVAVDGTFTRDGAPVLRLVTCGGEFDRASRHYRSNVVVTAVPA